MENTDRFLVSGWDDDLNDVDDTRNPEDDVSNQFLEAAEKGDLTTLQDLLAQNKSLINVVDKDKYTALHRACYGNHQHVVSYLLQNGANIAARTDMGWQPLHSACQWNSKECTVLLLQNGADVNAQSEGNQTPLHIAASHGASYDAIQLLLMHPYIEPHLKNNSNETASDIARRSSKYYNIFDAVDPLLDLDLIETIKK